jgi:pyrroloquinoline quinone biosynthesis protein D
MNINPETALAFSPLHRLQWEEAQQKHVILYPEGMVELNATAAEILQLCNGRHGLHDIVAILEQKFETSGLENDVREMLEAALSNGWIKQS